MVGEKSTKEIIATLVSDWGLKIADIPKEIVRKLCIWIDRKMRIRSRKKTNKDFIKILITKEIKEHCMQLSNLSFVNPKVYENQIKYKFFKLLSQHQTKQGK